MLLWLLTETERGIRVNAMHTAILETFPEPNRRLLQRFVILTVHVIWFRLWHSSLVPMYSFKSSWNYHILPQTLHRWGMFFALFCPFCLVLLVWCFLVWAFLFWQIISVSSMYVFMHNNTSTHIEISLHLWMLLDLQNLFCFGGFESIDWMCQLFIEFLIVIQGPLDIFAYVIWSLFFFLSYILWIEVFHISLG